MKTDYKVGNKVIVTATHEELRDFDCDNCIVTGHKGVVTGIYERTVTLDDFHPGHVKFSMIEPAVNNELAIGTEKLVYHDPEGWIKGEAIYYDKPNDVMVFKTEFGYDAYSEIKPVISERAIAVDGMMTIRNRIHWSDREFCEELYDLNYRKQLPKSQQVSILQEVLTNMGDDETVALVRAQALYGLLQGVE